MEPIVTNTQDTKPQVKVSQEDLLAAIRTILLVIGEDPEREGLVGTPDRIVRMWQEIFRGYDPAQKPKITTFSNEAHESQMVFDSGEFYSMCEHHMMPFFGNYYFAYLPDPEGKILGLSKIARVVNYCAARLQLQERLVRDIIQMIDEALEGRCGGYAIVMNGQHMCKTMRGVKNKGSMSVSYFTGAFQQDEQLRNEFFQLISLQKLLPSSPQE